MTTYRSRRRRRPQAAAAPVAPSSPAQRASEQRASEQRASEQRASAQRASAEGPTATNSSAQPPRSKLPLTDEQRARVAASPFSSLGLVPEIVRALLDEGYETPSPVQVEVIPSALAGRDVLGAAQTGTGKTAAFVLPILQQLAQTPPRERGIRALILTPTRELAAQIGERIGTYGHHLPPTYTVIYGGVSQRKQEDALASTPDILVATPGRLLDLMQQGFVKLSSITHYVLDEADRMLDMGFVHDVRRVTSALPNARQTLFFSATIPPAIDTLARGMLRDPVRVAVTPTVTTAVTVEQSVMFVAKADKRALLERVLSENDVERAIVFTRTKHGANRLAEQLGRAGIVAAAIHGNKSQGARERALEGFRKGALKVLVATDLAARGIDVDGVSHVINFELPNVAESYVHRIGRAGRAGATGRAISFCDGEERELLTDIERLIRRRLPSSGELPVEPPPGAQQLPLRNERPSPVSHGGRGGGGGGGRRSFRPRGR